MVTQVHINILQQVALGNLASGRGIAQSLGFALIAASTAVANVDGMRESSAAWAQLGNQVELVKRDVTNAVLLAKEGWIADDREAFIHTMDRFLVELDDLKAYMNNAATAMDYAHDIYKALWMGLAAIAAATLVALLALLAMFPVPYIGQAAKIAAETLAGIAALTVDAIVKAAATALSGMGAIVGASAAAGFFNFGLPEPTGGPTGREDLRQITIDYRPPSTYVMPRRNEPEAVEP